MASVEDELEFDMWDGQFEFFGNNFAATKAKNGEIEKRQKSNDIGGIYDKNVDLILTPITTFEDKDSLNVLPVAKMMPFLEEVTNDVRFEYGRGKTKRDSYSL
jgi:hypothetical protein